MDVKYNNDVCVTEYIVGEVKSQGIFDNFRKECLADVDTKPAYQNLRSRVETSVNNFLDKQLWKSDLNKSQLREMLRKHIHDAPYLDIGVERIVDQVVNPKVYNLFLPQVEDVVYKFLGIEKPKPNYNLTCSFKDLLPKDLDPISPESDKNSPKDLMFEKNINYSEEIENQVIDQTSSIFDKHYDANLPSIKVHESNIEYKFEDKNKIEEDEEDSPMFEPIEINPNDSNVSNETQLSGVSELTSHRSPSPGYISDSYYSNQDFQLSKVCLNSQLSLDLNTSNFIKTLTEKKKYEIPSTLSLNENFLKTVGKSENCDNIQVNKSKLSLLDLNLNPSNVVTNDPKSIKNVKSFKQNILIEEAKDLKDIYKEKIREIREKKEMTEKEKLKMDTFQKAHKYSKFKQKKNFSFIDNDSCIKSYKNYSDKLKKIVNIKKINKNLFLKDKNVEQQFKSKKFNKDLVLLKEGKNKVNVNKNYKITKNKNVQKSTLVTNTQRIETETENTIFKNEDNLICKNSAENKSSKNLNKLNCMYERLENELAELLPIKKRPLSIDELSENNDKTKKVKLLENNSNEDKISKKLKSSFSSPDTKTKSKDFFLNSGIDDVPDEERVQIIEIPDEECDEPYPENKNLSLEETSKIILESEEYNICNIDCCNKNQSMKSNNLLQCTQQPEKEKNLNLSESYIETKLMKNSSNIVNENKSSTYECSEKPRLKNSQRNFNNDLLNTSRELSITEFKVNDSNPKNQGFCFLNSNIIEIDFKINEKSINNYGETGEQFSTTQKADEKIKVLQDCNILSISTENDEISNLENKNKLSNFMEGFKEQSIIRLKNFTNNVSQINHEEIDIAINTKNVKEGVDYSFNQNNFIGTDKKIIEFGKAQTKQVCSYLEPDNDKYCEFLAFFESLDDLNYVDIIQILGGQVISPIFQMKLKSENILEEKNEFLNNKYFCSAGVRKRKLKIKKNYRESCSILENVIENKNLDSTSTQELDAIISSDRGHSLITKDEKGRGKNSQRYSSDDLYKPRPLFSSSSRRNRRSNNS